jgi:hypothetical protein
MNDEIPWLRDRPRRIFVLLSFDRLSPKLTNGGLGQHLLEVISLHGFDKTSMACNRLG